VFLASVYIIALLPAVGKGKKKKMVWYSEMEIGGGLRALCCLKAGRAQGGL